MNLETSATTMLY